MYVSTMLAFPWAFSFQHLKKLRFFSLRESLSRPSEYGILKCIGLGAYGKLEDKEVDADPDDPENFIAIWLVSILQSNGPSGEAKSMRPWLFSVSFITFECYRDHKVSKSQSLS